MKKELNLPEKFEKADRNFGIFGYLLIILVLLICGIAYILRSPLPESKRPVIKTPTSENGCQIRFEPNSLS